MMDQFKATTIMEGNVVSVYWPTRIVGTIARRTPRAVRHTAGYSIAAAGYFLRRSERHMTLQNMALVTGRSVHDPGVHRLAYASWKNDGRYASDFLAFPDLDIEPVERHARDMSEGVSSGYEYIECALKHRRGVIIATAHFGNWDLIGAILARHYPFTAIAETFSDPRLNRFVQDQRRERGIEIIPIKSSVRRLLRVLQSNHLVALVVDRPLPAEKGIGVSFFGRTTYVPAGPARLAFKSGAIIVPGFGWYGHRNQF
jgi:lauroyl/myristoyl acyltransferase